MYIRANCQQVALYVAHGSVILPVHIVLIQYALLAWPKTKPDVLNVEG